jgi:hypothetical protein
MSASPPSAHSQRHWLVTFSVRRPCAAARVTSWAAAHLADENVSGYTVSAAPLLGFLKIHRVGQFRRGLIGRLAKSRPPQGLNYFLPAVQHEDTLLDEERR